MLHCFSATAPLSGSSRRGCDNSSGKTTAGSALDSNGNTLTKAVGSDTTTYAWDFENRLTSVTLPGSGGGGMVPSAPFGRPTKKVTIPTTSIFSQDEGTLLLETNYAGETATHHQSPPMHREA